ncbi:MAG: N-acetylmuramoyl-L-alanine amidase family protein [Lawsonibacter sp.]|jgi:N-acetylmuramoyl-L-alanine amidase
MEVQYLTNNACYISGKPLNVKGVMVHSTGVNNPKVSRYVPGNDKIGYNQYGNHWDQYTPGGRKVCVHAFLGEFADGEIGVVQTLPWNMKGWHCGSGVNGSANDTHIGFEICEGNLDDKSYFEQTYEKAVQLVAMLCTTYRLDPSEPGVVICHSEGASMGLAGFHADVMHWWPKHGKSMDTFRKDVFDIMRGEKDLTENEVRTIVRDEFSKIEAERAMEPADSWAEPYIKDGIAMGITASADSKTMERPKSSITREEAVVMCVAAVKAAGKEY